MHALATVVFAVAMSLTPPPSFAEETVLMVVPDGSRDLELMLREEVGVMRAMLSEAGFAVAVATATDLPLMAGNEQLAPTVQLADVDVADYAGILLPCMAPAPGTPQPPAIDALVRGAHEAGIPLAASRGSVAFLARAGALEGRAYAYASRVDPVERPAFAGAEYLGTTVASSDGVSTAGICPLAARSLDEPDGTATLTRAFLRTLEGGS